MRAEKLKRRSLEQFNREAEAMFRAAGLIPEKAGAQPGHKLHAVARKPG